MSDFEKYVMEKLDSIDERLRKVEMKVYLAAVFTTVVITLTINIIGKLL